MRCTQGEDSGSTEKPGLASERRKSEAESENDPEPDLPHGTSEEDGWRGV